MENQILPSENQNQDQNQNNNDEKDESLEDMLRKLLYSGVGLASAAKDKLEMMVKKLISENKISAEEGEKIIKNAREAAGSKTKSFEEKIKGVVNDAIGTVKPVTKSELEDLKRRLAELEKKVGNL